ncbi:RNUT1 [Mytilus edulis]|uniref:SNUPN n=1 Tax=Mytilus edulis TaxID=6550 RepID=A0A8S3UHR0_MYTED|nr:RNUT1 [Mytilus edulis]
MLHQNIENEDCKANGDIVGEERFCFYTIKIDDWDKMHEIPVKWQDGAEYKLTGTEHIMQLKIQGSDGFDIWKKHTDIPPIKVKVHDSAEDVLTKQCRIVNDPHMRTFDKRTLGGISTLITEFSVRPVPATRFHITSCFRRKFVLTEIENEHQTLKLHEYMNLFDSMDELTAKLACDFSVSSDPNSTAAVHPRFSQYKSRNRIDQETRRNRILEEQKK